MDLVLYEFELRKHIGRYTVINRNTCSYGISRTWCAGKIFSIWTGENSAEMVALNFDRSIRTNAASLWVFGSANVALIDYISTDMAQKQSNLCSDLFGGV